MQITETKLQFSSENDQKAPRKMHVGFIHPKTEWHHISFSSFRCSLFKYSSDKTHPKCG